MAIYQDLFDSLTHDWLDASYGSSIYGYLDRADEWYERIDNTWFFYGYQGIVDWPTLEANYVNGLSAVSLPSGAFVQGVVNDYVKGLNSFTAFIVARVPTGRTIFSAAISPSGEEPEWSTYKVIDLHTASVYDSGTSSNRKAFIAGGKRLETDSVQTIQQWDDASNQLSLYVVQYNWQGATLHTGLNGTFVARGGGYQTAGTTPTSTEHSYDNFLAGYEDVYDSGEMVLCEIVIVLDEILSDADRQIYEGDLAHKWGVTLVSGHPYASAPPEIVIPAASFSCFGASGESSSVSQENGSASLPGIGAAGSALSVALDSGSSSLSCVGASGEASNVTLESGGFSSFKGIGASGESWQVFPASGDASLAGLGVSGSCRLLTNIAVGNSSLSCIGASGSSRTVSKAEGSASVAGIGVSGDSHTIYISTGEVALAGVGATGVCTHVFPGDGSASFQCIGASGTTSNIPLVATGNASLRGIGSAGSSTLVMKGDGAAMLGWFGASGSSRIIFQSTGNASFFGIGAIGSDDSTPMVAIGSAGFGEISATGYSVPVRVSYGAIVLGGIGALGFIPGADVFDGILDFDRESQGSGPFADSGAVSAVEFGRDTAPTGDLVDFGGSVNGLVFSRPSCS